MVLRFSTEPGFLSSQFRDGNEGIGHDLVGRGSGSSAQGAQGGDGHQIFSGLHRTVAEPQSSVCHG
jgi:hypothetical protein